MAGFAVRLIAPLSRCLPFFYAMSLLAPIELVAADKLEVLQRLDRYRKWRSLDEKRYCLACGRIIEGGDILVVGGTRGTGPLRLVCPTPGCHSIPMDWVIPTDEVLARMGVWRSRKVCHENQPGARGKNSPPGCASLRSIFGRRPNGVSQVPRV